MAKVYSVHLISLRLGVDPKEFERYVTEGLPDAPGAEERGRVRPANSAVARSLRRQRASDPRRMLGTGAMRTRQLLGVLRAGVTP